jgi:3'-phosphoadenosine 5'-phosphosulfate sulfotransferase (PAPS reductase)/FAD synthetase
VQDNVRHVLGISGGKDSAALAIFMRDRVPQMEYFFCDTGAELPETYEYLTRLEAFLGKPIARLNSGRTFDHWLTVFRGALPSPQMRWCTTYMKIKPLEAWLGDTQAISYVAIRADEPRVGYVSTKPNITTSFPFKEEGIDFEGVKRILANSGVGLPTYYEWRTRSGCYFCFFQRKAEWVGLAERHPKEFNQAVEYEQKASFETTAMQGRQYTWSQGETLIQLISRKEEILTRHKQALARETASRRSSALVDVLADVLDDEDDSEPCQVCSL